MGPATQVVICRQRAFVPGAPRASSRPRVLGAGARPERRPSSGAPTRASTPCRPPSLPPAPRVGSTSSSRGLPVRRPGQRRQHHRELPGLRGAPPRWTVSRRRASSPSRSTTCTTPWGGSCSSRCWCRRACWSAWGSGVVDRAAQPAPPRRDGRHGRGHRGGGPVPAGRDHRRAHRGGPARQRPQHHAHRHRGGLRGARRLRGAAAAVPGRRLARVAHAVDVDPGLRRAVRPRRA